MNIGPEEEPPEKLWKNDDYSESSDISSHANASIQLKLPRTIGKTGGRIPIVPAESELNFFQIWNYMKQS